MNPKYVPADLIEKMLSTRLPVSETEARVLLAAVLPEIQARALRDAAAVFAWAGDDEDYAIVRAWLRDRADRLAATSEDRKTADEWCQQLAVKVIDPDGWRTSDGTSWDTPITETEFHERAARSTIAAIVTDTDEVRERFARSMGIPIEAITPTPGSNPHDVAIAQGKKMMTDIEEPTT